MYAHTYQLIKEKIGALEMQMKMDEEDVEDEEDLEEMGILGVGGSPTRDGRKRRKRKSESDSNRMNNHAVSLHALGRNVDAASMLEGAQSASPEDPIIAENVRILTIAF